MHGSSKTWRGLVLKLILLAWTLLAAHSAQAQVGPGHSIVFEKTGSRLSLTNTLLSPPWTVELWVRRQDSASVSAPLFVGSTDALKLEQYQSGRRVGFTRFGQGDYSFNYVAPTNEWVHLAITATTGETCLFANGQFIGCTNVEAFLPLDYFGSSPARTGEQLRAEVDEIRIWRSERSAPEIQYWMSRRLSGAEEALVGYWSCNDDPAGPLANLAHPVNGPSLPAAKANVVTGRVSTVPFAADVEGPSFTKLPGQLVRLESRVHSGNLPTTVEMRLQAITDTPGKGLVVGRASETLVTNGIATTSSVLPLPANGRVYLASIVASNAAGMTFSAPARVWAPAITIREPDTINMECHDIRTNLAMGARMLPVGLGAGGEHSFAIRADGGLVNWGANYFFQSRPPAAATNVVAVAGGDLHSTALLADGSVLSWGWNGLGQLNVPSGLRDAIAIACGHSHSLALTAGGRVFAWGWNDKGQATVPPGLSNVVAIAAGWHHSLAVKADGTVIGWGDNTHGELTVPKEATNVVAVSAGDQHSAALTADGRVVTWGWDAYGQTAFASTLRNVTAISAGARHLLALKTDGKIAVWGENSGSQQNPPVITNRFIAITSGFYHNLAITDGGKVLAWGQTDRTLEPLLVPSNVVPVIPVTADPAVIPVSPGIYSVVYSVPESVGPFTFEQQVSVVDSMPPGIVILAGVDRFTQGKPFVDAGVSVYDGCDTSPVITTNGVVDVNTPGRYRIDYTATDASGNQTAATRTVVVEPVTDVSGEVHWTGSNAPNGTGFWYDAANWDPFVIPRNTGTKHFSVIVDGAGLSEPPNVLMDLDVTLDSLRIRKAAIEVNSASLTLQSEEIPNNGLLRVREQSAEAWLFLQPPQGVVRFTAGEGADGPGRLQLMGASTVRVFPPPGSPDTAYTQLYNGSGHEILGTGQIQAGGLVNDGQITSEQKKADPNSLLTLSAQSITNRSRIIAHPPGQLIINSSQLENTGGTLLAERRATSSPTLLLEGANRVLRGGVVQATEGGWIRIGATGPGKAGPRLERSVFVADDASQIEMMHDVSLVDTVLRSPLRWGSGSEELSMHLQGVIRNESHQVLSSPSNPGMPTYTTEIQIAGDTTLTGGGSLRLVLGNHHMISSFGARLTNAADHVISGAGLLGSIDSGSTGLALINEGLIDGDEPNLNLNPSNFAAPPMVVYTGSRFASSGGRDAFNFGELRASKGGALRLLSMPGTVLQHYGLICADGGVPERASLAELRGEVQGPGWLLATNGGRIVLPEGAPLLSWGLIDVAAGSLFEANDQLLYAPVRVQADGWFKVNGPLYLGSPLEHHGLATCPPGASLNTYSVSGDGWFFDPKQASVPDENTVYVFGGIDPGSPDSNTPGTLHFDRVNFGGAPDTMAIDAFGPGYSEQDHIEVRHHLSCTNMNLQVSFHYTPSPDDIITLIRSHIPGQPILDHLEDASFENVTRISGDLAYYHHGEYTGELHILPDRIYLTGIRHAATRPLSLPHPDPSNPKAYQIDASVTPGVAVVWQRSETLLPGSWVNVTSEIVADGPVLSMTFNPVKLPHAYFRAVEYPVACSPAPNGLVHAWRGGDGMNSWGEAQANLLGDMAITEGRFGAAYAFDGVDDQIQLGAGSIPKGSDKGGWAASMWVRRERSPDVSSALFMSSTHALKLEQYGTADRRVGFTAYGVGDYSFPFTVPAEWTHLVFMDTAAGTVLYANGVQVGLNSLRIPLPLDYLGGGTTDRLKGAVDEIYVFNRELTPQEIQDLSLSPLPASLCR